MSTTYIFPHTNPTMVAYPWAIVSEGVLVDYRVTAEDAVADYEGYGPVEVIDYQPALAERDIDADWCHPDDDDYLACPALGRTHPYGTGAL